MPILNTPHFIFHTALDFFSIGKNRVEQIFKTNPRDNPYLWYDLTAPAVNLSFSLELMFKAVILKETGVIEKREQTHHLKKLFDTIPEQSKNRIVNIFSELKKEEFKFPAIRFSTIDSVETNNYFNKMSLQGRELINELLLEHDTAFLKWRYSFELSNLNNNDKHLCFDFGTFIRLIETTSIYLETLIK